MFGYNRAVQLPAAGMCRPTTATTCELAVEAKCQSVKVATKGWRNLSAQDVPANGIAVENVRYAPCQLVFHVD